MPRNHNTKGRSRRTPDDHFVQVYKTMLDEPAWKALPFGARCLYLELKALFNGANNGELFLSVRTAASRLGCAKKSAAAWFGDLQEKGFIRPAEKGSLTATGKGKATRWVLTELGLNNARPTREYRDFEAAEKTESRTTEGDRVSYSGVQESQKCPTEGDRCPTEGYRKRPKSTRPCTTEGYTSTFYHVPPDNVAPLKHSSKSKLVDDDQGAEQCAGAFISTPELKTWVNDFIPTLGQGGVGQLAARVGVAATKLSRWRCHPDTKLPWPAIDKLQRIRLEMEGKPRPESLTRNEFSVFNMLRCPAFRGEAQVQPAENTRKMSIQGLKDACDIARTLVTDDR